MREVSEVVRSAEMGSSRASNRRADSEVQMLTLFVFRPQHHPARLRSIYTAPETMKLKPFLLAMLLASLLSAALPAHADYTIDDFTYSFSGSNATVTGVSSSIPYSTTSLTIPERVLYGGSYYTVTAIGNRAFQSKSQFTSISMPATVKTIGDYAFSSTGLTSIILPSSLISIGKYAFYNMSITSITIPANVTTMGENVFASCTSLANIYVNSGNTYFEASDGVLFTKNKYELVKYPEAKTATSYYIPSTVKTIGKYAFYKNNVVSYVSIPSSVITIDNGAFYGSRIQSVSIGGSVVTIGDFSFRECSNLESIDIPNSVKAIGENAFYDCTNLTDIKLGNSVETIGPRAFAESMSWQKTAVPSLTIPESVTSIGVSAFWGYEIQNLFFNATNCTYCGNSSNPGGPGFFSVRALTIGDNVETIPPYAFYDSNNVVMRSLTIPASVKSIGVYAFYGCYGLKDATCNATVPPALGSLTNSFAHANCPLSVPRNSRQAYIDAGYDQFFSSVISAPAPKITVNYTGEGSASINGLTVENGAEIEEDAYTLSITSGVGWKLGSVKLNGNDITPQVVDNQITLSDITSDSTLDIEFVSKTPYLTFSYTDSTLKAYVKCNDTSITQAEIPAEISHDGQIYNVTGLDSRAFYGCSNLTSIEIPNSVSYIGDDSFSSCSKLTSIRLPSAITSISSGTFNLCASLISLEIPNSVTSIGDWAFNGCKNLTSIVIPNSVTSIGSRAFYGCYGLVSVVFEPDVPPTLSGNTCFTNSDCVAYVHRSSRQAYLNAGYATCFKTIESLESLTVNYTGNGEILYQGNAIGNGMVYEDTEAFDFIVLPNDGWKIQSVTLDGEDVSGQLVNHHLAFTAPAAKSILDILFTENAPVVVEPTYATLSVTNNSGHTHTHYYVEGHDAKIAFTPQENWELHSVTLNDEDVTYRLENNMLTIPAIAGDNTLDVVYRENKATSVEKASIDQLQIRVANKTVTITGKEAGETVRIYDEQGAMLYMGTDSTIALGVKDCIILINVRGETYKALLR